MPDKKEILSKFKTRRVLYPIIIGLAVVVYMYYEEFGSMNFSVIKLSAMTILWLFIALLMMGVRDLAYIIRLKILAGDQISWRRCFSVIMLWEFASAVTPSIIGGAPIALYFLTKEGVALGRSTAIIMITGLLDELFYIIMVPTLILLVGISDIFPENQNYELFGFDVPIKTIFWSGYCFIVALTTSILLAFFYNPRGFKYLLVYIFKIRGLRKWRLKAAKTGTDIITSSKEFKGKSLGFWLKAFGATFLSWTARYWVVNFVFLAFVMVDDHFLLYARQLIMWVIMLIGFTPGSAGFAEGAFGALLSDFAPNEEVSFVVVMIWRTISFYLYLIFGAIILPRWLKRIYSGAKSPATIS